MDTLKEEQQKSAAREQVEREVLNYCFACLHYRDFCQFSMLSQKMGGLVGFLDLCDEHNLPAPIDDLKRWTAFVFDLHAEQQAEAERMGF